jgi:hypothetical protein
MSSKSSKQSTYYAAVYKDGRTSDDKALQGCLSSLDAYAERVFNGKDTALDTPAGSICRADGPATTYYGTRGDQISEKTFANSGRGCPYLSIAKLTENGGEENIFYGTGSEVHAKYSRNFRAATQEAASNP